MSHKPPWKSLVEDLKRPEHDDPYLERLARRFDTGNDARSLQRELIEEMGSALKRAEAKLVTAIEACVRAGDELDGAGDSASREAARARYESRRSEAQRARWELVIHREALGLYRHDDVDHHHRIPPRRADS